MRSLNNDLHKMSLWARQLSAEYEDICWRYKVDLVPAGIEISDMKTYQGYWDPAVRTIKISKNLIEKYTWDITVNVFKHEMAHQIVTEIFKTHDGHGKTYQKACDMIGVPHGFRSAGGDIPEDWENKEQKREPENKKLLEKVEKLLSLAQSVNENEAALAMQRANELIKKYNLKRGKKNETPSAYGYVIINHKKKRVERCQKEICSLLSEFFFVKHIYSCLYDSESLTIYKTIELIGTLENIKIAEHVYYFLLSEMNHLWKDYKKRTHSKPGNKNSYFLGVVKGFREKLLKQERKNDSDLEDKAVQTETTSLMVLSKDAGLSDFVSQRFPRLHTVGWQGPRINAEAYREGSIKGSKITLHKGVTKSNGFLNRMLTKGQGNRG